MPRLDAERIDLWRRFCMISAHVQRLLDQQLTDLHNVPLAWYDVLLTVASAPGKTKVAPVKNLNALDRLFQR